ncbi:MAG: cytochrome c, partial [Desulfuromonas sp.]
MKCTIFVRLFATTLMWVFFSVPFQPQLARGENAPATIGKELFQAKCSPCHTIGGGRSVGPDLKGVTAIRDHAWLARFIPAPDHVLASGDQVANELLKEFGGLVMPDLGLTQTQVDELIAYLA